MDTAVGASEAAGQAAMQPPINGAAADDGTLSSLPVKAVGSGERGSPGWAPLALWCCAVKALLSVYKLSSRDHVVCCCMPWLHIVDLVAIFWYRLVQIRVPQKEDT